MRPGRLTRPGPAAGVWALAAVLAVAQLVLALRAQDPLVDLHVYRDAGLSLLHHRPVYAHETPTHAGPLPFTYPAFSALLAIPLALLPFRLDAVLWMLAVDAVLLGVLVVVLAPLRERWRGTHPTWEPLVLPVAALVATHLVPVADQVWFGQVGVFLLGLVVLDLLTPATGRWRGVLVGLATAVKLTPGVFVVALLVAGRRPGSGVAGRRPGSGIAGRRPGSGIAGRTRSAAVAAATFVTLTLLAAALAPGTSGAYWLRAVFEPGRLGDNADAANQSLRGLALRSLPAAPATAAYLAVAAVVAVVGLRKAAAAWRAGDDLSAVALAGLLTALLSPVAWVHHYVFLVPLLAALARDGRWRWVVGLVLLWSLPVPDWGQELVRHGTLPVLLPVWTLLEDCLGAAAALVVLLLPVDATRHAAPVPARRRLATLRP